MQACCLYRKLVVTDKQMILDCLKKFLVIKIITTHWNSENLQSQNFSLQEKLDANKCMIFTAKVLKYYFYPYFLMDFIRAILILYIHWSNKYKEQIRLNLFKYLVADFFLFQWALINCIMIKYDLVHDHLIVWFASVLPWKKGWAGRW